MRRTFSVLLALAGVAGFAGSASASGNAPAVHTFNISDCGAKGDGATLDTEAINHAIDLCAKSGGGQVLIPPGRYVSGTVHLRSGVTLFLAAGATLAGTTNLDRYEHPEIPSYMPEARSGKWHYALIVGENVENVAIAGPGVIDGRAVFDPNGEEHRRGPHAVIFVNSRHFAIRDVSIVDAGNYAIFFEVCDDVDIRNVRISGGWDGVHFRGARGHWCHNVNIIGCQFYTGDDSIAGRCWDNVVISNCILNSMCNGIRLIGPATRLLVSDCLFYGPGQSPHNIWGRRNMLCGIILQPGAWGRSEGPLDDVFLANNTMRDVAAPVTIWTKPGTQAGCITVSGLNATGVNEAALSVESWSDAPITNVVLRNASIEFAGGGKAGDAREEVRGPGVDVRPLPAWGVYARNVERLTIEDVRLSVARDDLRPVLMADNVRRLILDDFKFTRVPGVADPLMTTNVGKLTLLNMAPPPSRGAQDP